MKVIWLGDEDAQTTNEFGVTFEPGVEVDVSSLPEWQQKKLANHPSFAAEGTLSTPKPQRGRRKAEPVAQPEPEPAPEAETLPVASEDVIDDTN